MFSDQVYDKKIKLGIFEYINSKLISQNINNIINKFINLEYKTGNPKYISNLFCNSELINISQVSLCAYLDLYKKNNSQIKLLDNFCIACNKNKIQSVCLFSNKSIENLDNQVIILSQESFTANCLLKVIFKFLYNIKPVYIINNLNLKINNTEPVLLIGDQALIEHKKNQKYKHWKYSYDLVTIWTNWQKLPFVFSVFCIKNYLLENTKTREQVNLLIEKLLENLNSNIKNKNKLAENIIRELPEITELSSQDIQEYLDLISYNLTDKEKLGIQKFSELKESLNSLKSRT